MTFREVRKILESNGWKAVKRTSTSHVKFKKVGNKYNIPLSCHGENSEIPVGTLKAIFRKAGIAIEQH